MQTGTALRLARDKEFPARGLENCPFLLFVGRSDYEKQGNLVEIQSLALHLPQPGLPGMVDIGIRRRGAFQPKREGLVEDQRNEENEERRRHPEREIEFRFAEGDVVHAAEKNHRDRDGDEQTNSVSTATWKGSDMPARRRDPLRTRAGALSKARSGQGHDL